MKWWLLLLPGGLLILAWLLMRRQQATTVSEAWLDDHARRASGTGIDGINWHWPVNKRRDEAAAFNRFLLRKRA